MILSYQATSSAVYSSLISFIERLETRRKHKCLKSVILVRNRKILIVSDPATASWTGGRVVMALRLGKCRAFPPLNSRSSKERGFESHPVHSHLFAFLKFAHINKQRNVVDVIFRRLWVAYAQMGRSSGRPKLSEGSNSGLAKPV